MKVTFACHHEDCGRTYQSRKNLQRHINHYHSDNDSLICKVCGKKLSSQQNFKEHNFIHTGEKPYVCDKCGMAFRQGSQLCSHKKIHSAVEGRETVDPIVRMAEILKTESPPTSVKPLNSLNHKNPEFGESDKPLPSFLNVFPDLPAHYFLVQTPDA